MKVVYHVRKPFQHQFSIEKVFDGIEKYFSSRESVEIEKLTMPFLSTGLFNRMKNVLWSMKHQGDINHITGDAHYIALGLEKRKTILTIHDLNFLNHANPLARFILRIFWLTLPLKKVTYVTVISEATKNDLLSRIKFPENRIKVIPNYCDPAFRPSVKEFNKVKPRLLQIGTKENKNVLRLIEAVNGFVCHLVIIGGENHRIKESLERNRISYTWLQKLTNDELIEQYKLCDVLGFVSTIEGFGMPILEAQATGRVVVTSSISSMPEVGGNAACYVDALDVISIRRGILKVIENDEFREELILKGFENIKRFELKNMAMMYAELYKEVYSSIGN